MNRKGLLCPIYVSRRARVKYRACLIFCLFLSVVLMGAWYLKKIDDKVPNHIYLYQNQETEMSFDVPLSGTLEEAQDVIAITNGTAGQSGTFALSETVNVTAGEVGSCQASLKLFGLIPYKYIQFDVIEEAQVMPSGQAVGLYVQSDGIMVLGTSVVKGKDGMAYEPAKEILQAGDTIQKVDGTAVTSIDEVVSLLQAGTGKRVTLEIQRNRQALTVRLEKILTADGQYKIGVWLREDTEGIGTLTFVTEENRFAALGHGITDVDTGKLIALNAGSVFVANIEDIKKGEAGSPGELVGSVLLGTNSRIGEIESNTALGITGTITGEAYRYREEDAVLVGLKQEVTLGEACVLCQPGGTVEQYQIEIEQIDVNSTDNKGMTIRVTDEALLKKTGGIVQGMSGAPILQNGKLIGAVTHVFVNDPTGGYATFVENML